MKQFNFRCFKTLIFCVPFLGNVYSSSGQCTAPAAGCSGTDFSNSFIDSGNPNTLEYDNIVSGFHSTFARQADGRILVWGEFMGKGVDEDILNPIELNSTNYPGLTGSVLKYTIGSNGSINTQYAVLTTTGLFVGGKAGLLVATGIKSSSTFGSITVNGQANGLPPGILPGDVKMLYGSYGTLVITTCSGNVWVLSSNGNKNGDGTAENAASRIIWHKVKTTASTDLTNVVATRGATWGLMALTSNGNIYTWGTNCYLGDGIAASSKAYATLMTKPTLPAGVVPKMIGMQEDGILTSLFSFTTPLDLTYYILASNGSLYSLGDNTRKQLGDYGKLVTKKVLIP